MIVKDDPAIEAIREIRHSISGGCGHDPRMLVKYYIELQEEYQDRIAQDFIEEESAIEPAQA